MGVYLCLGQDSHNLTHAQSVPFSKFKSFDKIQEYVEENARVYVFLGESKHKIKKKAEQAACKIGVDQINKNN
jgi:UDP-N-acetylmuramoylalanine-D-glutamate ligase